MAQSHQRPAPPGRAITSPPLSPVTPNEKYSSKHGSSKHSSKSKSERDSSSRSKQSRPGTLSRKMTPVYMSRSSSGQSARKDRREEALEEEDDDETFFQYCSFCEKQISGCNGAFLYCSETCRIRDLSSQSRSHSFRHSSSYAANSPPMSPSFSRSISTYYQPEGPDIIPRASPTISRPLSYFGSNSIPEANPYDGVAASLPREQSKSYSTSTQQSSHYRSGTSSKGGSSNALASLRELSAALETSKSYSQSQQYYSDEDNSVPASPTNPGWSYNLNPFSGSSTSLSLSNPPKPVARSYTQPAASGYNHGSRGSLSGPSAGYGNVSGTSYSALSTTVGTTGMDRPLPPRSGGYGNRPKSMDLVTPFSGA